MNIDNIILNSDSYKTTQYVQYPPNTSSVFSYIESRGGEYDETVFMGIQMFIKEYLTKPITQEMIDEAEWFIDNHIGVGIFNRTGWQYILDVYDGYLPLRIKAVPEGTVVPTSNILVSVENTDPECFWLTSYIETPMLRAVWYPMTVATKSRAIKKIIKTYLDDTGSTESFEGLDFMLHDFGARGVSSFESAGIGGAAHLINFKGSDTMTGALFAMKYYNTKEMPSFSVPAAEHSTITAWGKLRESDAYRNMFSQFGGKFPIVSVVSDSYDVFNATEKIWGGELKPIVDASGSVLVVRPDSGEPADVVGKIAEILDEKFGSDINTKGFKVLKGVKILQGDGLSTNVDFHKILDRLKALNFSTENIVFGMGGGLLQQVNRDTCKMAMKASHAVIDGKSVDIYKDPITDIGKRSKRGRLALVKVDGEFQTVTEVAGAESLLKPVYENGKIGEEYSFDEIRQRAAI